MRLLCSGTASMSRLRLATVCLSTATEAVAQVALPTGRFITLATTDPAVNAPGMSEPFTAFGTPYINGAGDVVFGATTASTDGVWMWRTASSSLISIVLTGAAVPGIPGAAFDRVSGSFGDPVLNANGTLVFHFGLANVPGAAGPIAAVWRAVPSGSSFTLSLVAKEGDTIGSLTAASFADALVNVTGDVVLRVFDESGRGGVYYWNQSTFTELALEGAAPVPPIAQVSSVLIERIVGFDLNRNGSVALLLASQGAGLCSGSTGSFQGVWSGSPGTLNPVLFTARNGSGTVFGEPHGILRSDVQLASSNEVLTGTRFQPSCTVVPLHARSLAVTPSGGQTTLVEDYQPAPGTADAPEGERLFFLHASNCGTINTADYNRAVGGSSGGFAFVRELQGALPECGGETPLDDCPDLSGSQFEQTGVWFRPVSGTVSLVALGGQFEWGGSGFFAGGPFGSAPWGVRPAISANDHIAFSAPTLQDLCSENANRRTLFGLRHPDIRTRTHLIGIDDTVFSGARRVADFTYGQFTGAVETSECGRGLLSDCGAAPIRAILEPTGSGSTIAVIAVTLIRPVADFNGDGEITVDDLFAFLAAFFAQETEGDFNGDGNFTSEDIFAFLAVYLDPDACSGYVSSA